MSAYAPSRQAEAAGAAGAAEVGAAAVAAEDALESKPRPLHPQLSVCVFEEKERRGRGGVG